MKKIRNFKPAVSTPTPAPETSTVEEFIVGAELQLSSDDKATLSRASDPLQAAYVRLAMLREGYLFQERAAMEEVSKQKTAYNSALVAVSSKYGVKIGPGSGQNWSYGGDTGILKRIG